MSEQDQKEEPETSASTPNSASGGPGGLKAAKDRSCPFCGQAFTSSSLGRHLDLYIKPKNPKPPDGVHDVQEIKKMRGGITRRQARTSLKGSASKSDTHRGDSGGWSSKEANKPMRKSARIADGDTTESPTEGKEAHMHTWFNAPSWQATGVINNLPARAPSRDNNASPATGQAHRMHEMRRNPSGNRIERPEYVPEDIWKLQESAEVGRAAEMALREVLGSLEAAKKKVEPPMLFEDFSFCSLSFPGLCLAILPPPPTLSSSTPFAAVHTWSLSPPGDRQKETLNRMLNERVKLVRKGDPDKIPDSVAFRHHVHLTGAWEHWQLLSEEDRSAAWNLELSRAFVREKEKKEQLRSELDQAQQRNRQLEAEYDRLSRCQLPREYLMHPPNTMPVSPAVMREMSSMDEHSEAFEAKYDAEALINKWKAQVKATTRAHKPPPTQSNVYAEKERNPMKGDILLNGSMFAVNGPMPRNSDAQGNSTAQPTVMYETPRDPGVVISAEDEGVMEVDADADADADGETEEPESYGNYANSGALTKYRQGQYDSSINGRINANGKRPLEPHATTGRGSGPRLHREQPKS